MNCSQVLDDYSLILTGFKNEIVKHAATCFVGTLPGAGLLAVNIFQSAATIYVLVQPKKLFAYELLPINGKEHERRSSCRMILGLSPTCLLGIISSIFYGISNIAFSAFAESNRKWAVNFVSYPFSYCTVESKTDILQTGNRGITYLQKHAEENIQQNAIFGGAVLAVAIMTLAASVFGTQRGVISTAKCIYAVVLIINLLSIGVNLFEVITAKKCHISAENTLNQWGQYLNQTI